MKRINHREAYSKDGACTNQAESYISRLRRAEIGQHHHIAGPISTSMLAKWRGAKTCAATTPEPNSTHVAVRSWATRHHVPGRDIGSGIAGGRARHAA